MGRLFQIRFIFSLLLAVGIVFVASQAVAEKTPKLHKSLQTLKKNGSVVEYLGHKYGLDGWLVRQDDNVQYIYTTPQGGLITGILFGPDEYPVTVNQIMDYKTERVKQGKKGLPTPSTDGKSTAEQFYEEVEKTHWVSLGDANAPHMYVFANASCPHCHEYLAMLKPHMDEGLVSVRLILVGVTDKNQTASIGILSSDNWPQAWQEYADGFNAGKAVPRSGNEMGIKRAAQNNAVWAKWKIPLVPYTVYRGEGGTVKIVSGAPENILLMLADVAL